MLARISQCDPVDSSGSVGLGCPICTMGIVAGYASRTPVNTPSGSMCLCRIDSGPTPTIWEPL